MYILYAWTKTYCFTLYDIGMVCKNLALKLLVWRNYDNLLNIWLAKS